MRKWKQQYSSLLIIAMGFTILYLFTKNRWLLIPVGLSSVAIFINPLGNFIHHWWMMLAKLLGAINSRILLFVLFFLILTPIAWLMRLFSRGTYIRSATGKTSLFMNRNHLFTKTDLEQPF